MDRINRSILVGVALIGLSGLAAVEPATAPAIEPASQPTTEPTTQPATQPTTQSAAHPSTQRVAAVPLNESQPSNRQDRNSRRNRNNRGSSGSYLASDPFAILRTRSIFVKGNQTIASDLSSGSSNRPGGLQGISGSKLVFNGVIFFGDEPNAMIEDTGTGNVSLVRAGDAIAAGRVSAISFDDMTYEANGQEKHVTLGQNMDGVVPSAAVTASVSSTMPSGTPDGSTPAATPAPTSSGGSPEDILAKMKAKRNQEMGIK